MSAPLRILLHDYSGHPFQVQLARELARRGHEVHHFFSVAVQTPRGALEKRDGDAASFSVAPIDPGEPLPKYSYVRRVLHERRYGGLLKAALAAFKPDIVLFSNTPPDAMAAPARWCRAKKVPYLFWLQDIYAEAIARIVVAKLGPLAWPVAWHYRRLEAGLLRGAAAVVAITDDFKPLLAKWGVAPDRITTIENWAPLDELPPRPHDNEFARAHDLVDKTVFVYSGTLGLKHNPALLSGLAEALKNRNDCRVVVVSEGMGADFLAREKSLMGLHNLVLLPFQPFARVPDVLGSADVVVAILEPDAGVFSVPSKVLTYHCAGRALLAAMPAENLAARLIAREQTGLVCDPREQKAFLDAAQRLLDDRAAREQMGVRARAYAEKAFDIEAIGNRFEALMQKPANRLASR